MSSVLAGWLPANCVLRTAINGLPNAPLNVFNTPLSASPLGSRRSASRLSAKRVGVVVNVVAMAVSGDRVRCVVPRDLLATYRFDEFGNPVAGSAGRFGWLGGKQRRTELASGVIQMGASYVPAPGRFLTPDPILGGSANAYDYADQDPVNAFDLDGTCSTKKGCAKARSKAEAKVRKAIANVKREFRQARTERASSSAQLPGGGNFSIPGEGIVKDAWHKAENFLVGVNDATSCSQGGTLSLGGSYVLESREGTC